jgi:diacylglycerol kinase (ATP)
MQIEFADEPGRTVLETLLFAGTLIAQTCGGGIRVAPNADVTDGLLDLVMLKKLNVLEVLRILPELVFRGQVRTGRLTTIQTRKVKISSEEPCLFQGDGEILGHTPVEIEVIPRAIRVLGAQ